MQHYTADELKDLPTLCIGQTCNLKVKTPNKRVWICRCGMADGMPYENQITIEELSHGSWVISDQYPG